jgi:hypothetical protein
MGTEITVYMEHGTLRGRLTTSGALGDLLELVDSIVVDEPVVALVGGGPEVRVERSVISVDELWVVVAPPGTRSPAQATWYDVVLECGPFEIAAKLPTKVGFDPDRQALRPGGTFVLFGRVGVSAAGSGVAPVTEHALAWVNRYAVDAYTSDLDLAAFFPGARHLSPAPNIPDIRGASGIGALSIRSASA